MVETAFNLSDFEYYLLVLARISSFIFSAPFFGQQGIPPLPKVGLSCVISLLIINSVKPETSVYYSAIGYGIIVIKEIVCGLIIGYMASICQYIVTYAGNIIDMDIGLTMASQFDPTLNTNVTITGNIYYYFMLLLMLLSDVHSWLLKALVDTFKLMPLGGQEFEWDFLLTGFIAFMTNMFILAFRIFIPIFATMLVLNVVLGVMAKVAPQMNMFSVGIGIKVLVGITILFFMVFLFPDVVDFVVDQMKISVKDIVDGMY